MNIMFVFNLPIIPYEGGVQRVTDILSRELLKRGHNIIYLCYKNKEAIEHYCFAAPQYYIELDNRPDNDIRNELRSLLEKHAVDVVVNQLTNTDLIKYLPDSVKRICGYHIQPYNTDGLSRTRIWNKKADGFKHLLAKYISFIFPMVLERFSVRQFDKNLKETVPLVDKICFISERFYPRVLSHIPQFPQHKMCAINNPNTYCVEDIEIREERKNTVLYVGRIDNYDKNAIGFVKIWELLSKRYSNWNAIVVGDGPDMEINKQYVRKHKIRNITFAGTCKEVSEFYAASKIIVIPSYGESWCMALTEAMAYGCVPVVYDTYETLHDIVDDGINGIISSPDVNSAAASVERLMKDDAYRHKLSSNAHEKVKQFDIKCIATQWETLLKNL